MKIEYTVEGRLIQEGKDWKCYKRQDYSSLSAVFDELEFAIDNSIDKSFEEMKEIIKFNYSHKTSRAKASIYYGEGSIDIAKYNRILPHIWIVKNE